MWKETEKSSCAEPPGCGNVKFFVDGECVSPGFAMEVAEEGDYMADYIIGREGMVSEIRFDRIDQA